MVLTLKFLILIINPLKNSNFPNTILNNISDKYYKKYFVKKF